MKKFIALALMLILIMSQVGCSDKTYLEVDKTDNSGSCKHNWKRIENYNEYTAVDKCSICGMTRMYTDHDNIHNTGTEAGFKMLCYRWDGYGISQKEVYTCDLGYVIINCLSQLQKTGEVIPKISDDIVDENTGELPVTPGTMWIECGSVGIFRLNPEWTEICKVQTHLGEGEALQMTDTLRELLVQAWNYYPNDCWSGTYENGEFTLQQVYKEISAVESISVDNIYIENKIDSNNNKITLSVLANESKTVNVSIISYQSDDNLGTLDSKDIVLVKGKETTVDFEFYGFYNTSYRVTITIDNTRITLNINSKGAN